MPHVKRKYAARAGIVEKPENMTDEIDEKFTFLIAGPNHFTWLVKGEYEGRDVSPAIAESLRAEAASETDGGDVGSKARFNTSIGYELYRLFGSVPTCVGHTKEYVRFWQGLGTAEDRIPPLWIWDPAERYPRHAAMWDQVDGFNLGTAPIKDFMTELGPDHATDIIETMWAGLDKPFFINQPNRGTVTNMPDDAFLEILCSPNMDELRPHPIGEAPVGLRGLWQQVLDTHELTAQAAMSGDREMLLRAFVCDPLVSSPTDAEAMMEELIAAERDALPDYWG
jgi:alpha-galactosidase